MKVPKEILKTWGDLQDKGDFKNIAEESGVDRITVANAFDGECSERTFNAINDYYAKKKARLDISAKKVTE